mgnify:FL=1
MIIESNGDSDTSNLTKEDKDLLEEIGELYITYAESGFSISQDEDIVDFKVISEVVAEETNLTLKGLAVPFKNGKIKAFIV